MSRDFSTVVDDFASERQAPSAPSLHFDLKRFINLRLPSIVIIGFMLAIPLSLAGWFLTPVEFTAAAQILYRTTQGGMVDGGDSRATSGDYTKFVNTEIAKLTGDNVMIKVLERPEVIALPVVREVNDKLTFLKSCIAARAVNQSELVNVTCTMKTRQEALQVLQVVIDIYERQALVDEQTEGSYKIDKLNEEIEDLEKDLAIQRKTIEELEGALGANTGGELPQNSKEAEQYRAEMLASEQRLKDAENFVASVAGKIERLEAQQESNRANPTAPIYEFPVEPRVLQDPRVAALQEGLVQLESSVDLLRESHQEAHPKLKSALKQLDAMKRNIEKQENLARADVLKALHGEFEQELEAAQRNVDDEKLNLAENTSRYDTYVKSEQEKASLASEDRARLQQYREDLTLDNEWLSKLRTEVKNRQLDEEAPARVRIVTEPYAPLTQGITKKLLMAALGMLAGFAVGIAYGVLRELLDKQIRTPRDLARISNLPIIASIPHLSEDKTLGDADAALLMAQHPNSVIADEYRRILARILFPEDNAAEISSLLVVSACPGEGKTSLACNLAVALEHANRKVLLIDLSSQRPSVEKTFGLKPSLGLSDLLENGEAREDLIRRTAFENLGVLGPGSNAASLAGRLASREMMDFMEWADEHFDHIIVDTPPLLLMSDAKLLAPAIDGVLYVVGAGRSTLGMVSRCLRELDLLRANTIGVVLNGIRSMRGGYLRQNQSLFYAYSDRTDFGVEVPIESMPEINIIDDEMSETVEAEVVLLPVDERDE